MLIPYLTATTETDIYKASHESQLLHAFEPKPGLFIAESPNVIERALTDGYKPISFLVEEEKLNNPQIKMILSENEDVPAYYASVETLNKLNGYCMTKGLLCAMRRRELPSLEDILKDAHRIAILEEIVNPSNLGSIFRNAAALGLDAVILTSGCTDPLYRRAARVSMGTVFQIPWTIINKTNKYAGINNTPEISPIQLPDKHLNRTIQLPRPTAEISMIKELGFKCAAMALRKDTISIADIALKKEDRLALILGTEGEGLLDETISLCDYTIKIPMYHEVDSLNVAAASAIAFYELMR